MKHVLRILDNTGDTIIRWDPVIEEATAIAEAKFNELRSQGALLVEVEEGKGQRTVQTFNKLATEIVAMPAFAGG